MGKSHPQKRKHKRKHKSSRAPEIHLSTEVPAPPQAEEEELESFFEANQVDSAYQAIFRKLHEPPTPSSCFKEPTPYTVPQESPVPPSTKRLSKLCRPSTFSLKSSIRRPEVVELVDTTAKDPSFLVYLKSYRNTVPVPKHWCQKRKFLHLKRGNDKMPFTLPSFIEGTGISKLRAQMREREAGKLLRQRMRERMNPKLGRLDIDYQTLHDAFFKNQEKPKMTIHGDIYYEGKENELKMRVYKPGQLSDELKMALGMPEGCPPPWFINMQRFGPPPSYPHLRIPGLHMSAKETAVYTDPLDAIKNRFATLDEEYKRGHWGEMLIESDVEEVQEQEQEQDTEAFIRNRAYAGFIDLTPLMSEGRGMISTGDTAYTAPAPVSLAK